MVAALVALSVAVLWSAAEWIQFRRTRLVRHLAFGPGGQAHLWVRLSPVLRIASASGLAWGLVVLLLLVPKPQGQSSTKVSQLRHVIVLLDVSPSMRLKDAGSGQTLTRMQRARELINSLFDRVPIQQYRLSVIAFYNTAIPVVIDTRDIEVVKNCFGDLPLHFAFSGKQTNLFAGLQEAARTAASWNPRSTILIVISDGDSVPASGMPRMPSSVANVLVVGVGDSVSGKFIDGRHSRQDIATLRQTAARLQGEFHNGNERHISSALIQQLTAETSDRRPDPWTIRDYALFAVIASATLLATLPVALHKRGHSTF